MRIGLYRILWIPMLLLAHNTFGQDQVAYYDALTLKKLYLAYQAEKPSRKIPLDTNVNKVLKYYFPNSLDIEADIQKNDFLKEFFAVDGSASLHSSKIDLFSFASSAGSLNVTNLADGIARFLIKRGKEELNVAFFNRMKNFLDTHDECKTLFPSSTEFLKNVDVARYAEFLQSLREAFYKDLGNLITGINQLINLPKYKLYLEEFPEIRLALRSLKIVNELSQAGKGIWPDSIIHQLSRLGEWDEMDPNLANSWKALDVISVSVRYVPQPTDGADTTLRWIKLSDINSLIEDKIWLNIYLGLLFQKMDGIQFKIKDSTKSVQAFMAENKSNIHTLTSLVENFITLANDVDGTIQDIRKKQERSGFTNDDFYSYIGKSINITEYGFKIANTVKPGIIDNRYIKIAKNGNNLYKNIYTKNYNNAVMDVYNILNQIFDDKDSLVKEKDVDNQLSPTEKTSLVNTLTNVEFPLTKVIEGILKYGNFMASVVKAESAEDVEHALDVVVLPSGSYSIKQKSNWNLSVNGYIGYAWDFSKISLKNQYAHGVYAPVGISLSHGSRKKCGFTFSGFMSLIDVGNVASYRLHNGNDEALKQEVRLESIFSPSGQLFLEYQGLPFAVGGGWRMTPKLFYSDKTTFIAVPSKDVFNLSVLIDIPLFTLKNWPFPKN